MGALVRALQCMDEMVLDGLLLLSWEIVIAPCEGAREQGQKFLNYSNVFQALGYGHELYMQPK